VETSKYRKNLKTRRRKIYAMLVKSHQDYKQEIGVIESINDTENGGEMEEGANVRTQNKQTKCVEKVKDSSIVFEARLLACMEKLVDKMTKMESGFEDMENNIKEGVRETLAKFARDSKCKMDQRIESVNDEVDVISEPTHGHIQPSTDTVKCNSLNFETQIKYQSNSCHNEENVKEPEHSCGTSARTY
jgi:hypothetical protein